MKYFVTFQSILWIYFIQLCSTAVIKEENKPPDCDAAQNGETKSFLWTVKRDPPSYLFGTIHVPYTRVWDYIPENVKMAFRQSENIFFELDLTNPYTMTSLANCQLLPRGEYLSNILPKDIYTRLKEHLQYIREKMTNWVTADQRGKGLYGEYLFDIIAGNWERKRPIWIMLLVNSLTESDIKSRENPVLDLYLAQEAERAQKVTGAVERVEEQCYPLNDLNFSQVLFALNRTLRQHESYRRSNHAVPFTTDDLIHHYNCGDLNDIIFKKDSAQVPTLLNSSIPPSDLKTAKLIDSYFRTELINKRNERMATRVSHLLRENPSESFFFAFGAGHFLGNNTVIDRLRKHGFDIEHTLPDAQIPKMRVHRRHKNKRRNKIGEDYGETWDDMDSESRLWLKRARSDQRKKDDNNKPFNDLWVRMETPRPELMLKQATDSNPFHSDSSQRDMPQYSSNYLQNSAARLAPTTALPASHLTLIVLVWTIFVHLVTT